MNYVQGLLVSPSNLSGDNNTSDNRVGELVVAMTGTWNGLPAYNPPQFVVPGISGILSVTISGSASVDAPCMLFCQGRLCDYILPVTFSVPSASGNAVSRIDLIAVKFTSVSISGLIGNQSVQQLNGNIVSESIGLNFNGVTWEYVEGVPGSGTPASPAGYEAFATITMTAGETAVNPANIATLFPSMAVLLGANFLTGTITGVDVSGNTGTPIVFSSEFASIPVVVANVIPTTVPPPNILVAMPYNITQNGFTLYVVGGPSGTTCTVNWQASIP